MNDGFKSYVKLARLGIFCFVIKYHLGGSATTRVPPVYFNGLWVFTYFYLYLMWIFFTFSHKFFVVWSIQQKINMSYVNINIFSFHYKVVQFIQTKHWCRESWSDPSSSRPLSPRIPSYWSVMCFIPSGILGLRPYLDLWTSPLDGIKKGETKVSQSLGKLGLVFFGFSLDWISKI